MAGEAEEQREVELVYHHLTTFTDGSFLRAPFDEPLVPPSPSPSQDIVASTDIILPSSSACTARLFLPTPSLPTHHKLPILLYFHGGGFLNFSTAVPMYHNFLCSLALHSHALIVSADYRLAPEHPLPAAYEDCFDALAWLNKQAKACTHPWLADHADFSKCFLGGDSAGANIVHQVALAAFGHGGWRKEEKEDVLEHISLKGMMSIHPFFTCGASQSLSPLEVGVWKWSGVAAKEHPYANPFMPDTSSIRSAPLPRTLVAIASTDGLSSRGIAYYQGLIEAGKSAKLFITENEGHVFHLFTPLSKNVPAFLDELRDFIQESD